MGWNPLDGIKQLGRNVVNAAKWAGQAVSTGASAVGKWAGEAANTAYKGWRTASHALNEGGKVVLHGARVVADAAADAIGSPLGQTILKGGAAALTAIPGVNVAAPVLAGLAASPELLRGVSKGLGALDDITSKKRTIAQAGGDLVGSITGLAKRARS